MRLERYIATEAQRHREKEREIAKVLLVSLSLWLCG
jgi:hypothetical protein